MKCIHCGKIRKQVIQYPAISWEHGYCPNCWGQKLLFIDDVKIEDIRLNTNPVDVYWHSATIRELYYD